MGHLFVWILEAIEQALRPRLKDAILDLNELEADPVGYLSSHDGIAIGPRTYPVVAVVSAIPLAILSGLFGWLLNALFFLNAGPWVVPVFGLIGLVLGPVTVWRLNRGGEANIVSSGVVFSKGKSAVLCPWDVFDPWAELQSDSTWVWLPLAVPGSEQITETVDGAVRRTGAAVDTPFASAVRPGVFSRLFRKTDPSAPPEKLKVKDAYAVRGSEFFPLLMRIAAAAKFASLHQRIDAVSTLLSAAFFRNATACSSNCHVIASDSAAEPGTPLAPLTSEPSYTTLTKPIN
ncbi:hypothetical protein [Fimbriiglobus ruber]|uniref:Uncharacterized protein n=1 Tax=Fimbriiglobus ruber TaxID=1908690 RepID=A0A225D5E9_9BACT|nr:hypothetical protein [Fimbriiglobus ruber]OWK34854.1 hypothetical protein FRUB_09696 [Fimbriiglobus ruber]